MDQGLWLQVFIENTEHVATAIREMADPCTKFATIYLYVLCLQHLGQVN